MERDVEIEIGRERGGRNVGVAVMMRDCDDDRIVLFSSRHVVGVGESDKY